jgi:hypothetical protein
VLPAKSLTFAPWGRMLGVWDALNTPNLNSSSRNVMDSDESDAGWADWLVGQVVVPGMERVR